MHPLDRIKKKNEPTVSIALMKMKPKSQYAEPKEDTPIDMTRDAMEEEAPTREEANKDSYEECPKCAKYQMLIGEAIAYYMQRKEDSEDKPDTREVEDEINAQADSMQD